MKRIVFLLILCCILGGCTKKPREPATRVVTGIQVRYNQNGTELHRTYTRESSMRSMLNYLRMLRPYGPIIPEGDPQTTCQITLQYSSGADCTFRQMGDHYLCKNSEHWEKIDVVQARLLYPLLLLLPSDTP